MPDRDQYPYAVRCSKCGARGTVKISEATTESLGPRGAIDRRFDKVPEPFEALSIQPIKFKCKTCDLEVVDTVV
jgi:hypothetical protein